MEPGARQSKVTHPFGKGTSLIHVASAYELFGDLVHSANVDGESKIAMKDPSRPLTIQCGSNSSINVYRIVNHELHVTPISVENAVTEGDMAIFCSSLVPMTREGRIDFDKLKHEVDVLEGLNIFHKVREDKIQETRQQEVTARIQAADENFWAGIESEIEENPDKLLYCPIFDSSCETGFLSRNHYSETVRH